MTGISSLDALAGMSELVFLECYKTWISNVSPLLNCKNLKYLNCSTTFIEATDDLVQMKQLKRLWIMRPQRLAKNDIAIIKEGLPDTIIRSAIPQGDLPTAFGWHAKNPAYIYMQGELFRLGLQGQHTRRIGDEEYWGWNVDEFEAH